MDNGHRTSADSLLSPYRVLDLADEKGQFCGKLLADLGADVIKIEKPGGDASRSIGPFYQDEPHPEKSLHWFSFNTGKRSITLDIASDDGRDIFKQLVSTADFILETYPPGFLKSLQLSYDVLSKTKPEIIMASITPFGQTGPHRDYKASDIVAWGLGGEMFPFGDIDRPPIRISHHSQAYLHAGLEAAVGAAMSLYHRSIAGTGEYIDVSIQEAVAHRAHHAAGMWDMEKWFLPHGRGVSLAHIPDFMLPEALGESEKEDRIVLWPCKDGFVSWIYWFGPMAVRLNAASLKWMESEGLNSTFLKTFDASQVDWVEITSDMIDQIQQPIKAFFLERTKAELLESALSNGVMLYPVSTSQDILEDAHRRHLDKREFWVEIAHPHLNTALMYPGPFCRFSETPLRVRCSAPLIGEHNQDIYEGELGITADEQLKLKEAGVI